MGNEPVFSDAAKRASDNVNAYLAFMKWDELRTKWMAIRLSDGGYDGTLYDTKRDAVRHQSDEFLCAYVSFRHLMQGSSAREMEIFLRFNRDAYNRGLRLPDPDDVHGGKDVAMTAGQHDYYSEQIRHDVMSQLDLTTLIREMSGK